MHTQTHSHTQTHTHTQVYTQNAQAYKYTQNTRKSHTYTHAHVSHIRAEGKGWAVLLWMHLKQEWPLRTFSWSPCPPHR